MAPGTERASEAEAEDREHFAKGAVAWTEDDAKAEVENADAGLDGGLGCGFPLLADLRQKAGAGGGGLVEQLIVAVAVDAGGGGDEERLRRVAEVGESVGKGAGGLNTAICDFALIGGGPAMSGNV